MSSIDLDAANPIVGMKNVDESGSITGLDAYKGESVFVIRAPKLPVPPAPQVERAQKALETPKLLAQEILAYTRAHRDLALVQYKQFVEKHGDPAELVRGYAKRVAPPEDFQARVKEFNTLVQTRLDETTKEINARYEKLETEFETAVERLFKVKPGEAEAPATNGNGAHGNGSNGHATTSAPEPTVTVTVTPEPTTDATPRKAAKKPTKAPDTA